MKVQPANAYEATIEGQKRQVNGFGEQGGLQLADGSWYAFARLNFKPLGRTPDESAKDIFGRHLLEAAKLRRENGKWFLNDELVPLEQWMHEAYLRAKSGEQASQYVTREILDSTLRHLPYEVEEQINGVAWFECDDGAGGWNTPILLRSFRSLPQDIRSKVQTTNPETHKTVEIPHTKPVPRFEKDFSVAIIPTKNGRETPLTIERELRELIKQAIAGGGNVPRTTLRTGKPEAYQPEKLLKSQVAERLVKAGLLGTDKSGRTTVFWAKQSAE